MSIAKRGNNLIRNHGLNYVDITIKHLPQTIPVLETTNTITKNYTEIITGGNVIDSGGSPIIDRGIVWNLTGLPTILDSSMVDDHNFNTGIWTGLITNLDIDTTYYIRSFGVNSTGIGYSPDVSATTYGGIDPPNVDTISATNIRYEDMSFSGESIYNGGSAIFENGIIVSLDPDPTEINGTVLTASEIGVTSFNVYWSDYASETLYYYKAYSINLSGTGYGNVASITSPLRSIPETTFYDGYVLDIKVPNFYMQGYMDSIGDDSVTNYGFLLSLTPGLTYPNDAINDFGVWDMSGQWSNPNGSFPVEFRLDAKIYDVSYYGNTYAVNNIGTGLGIEKSFILPSQIPQLTLDIPKNITHNSMDISSGHVTWDGGATITEQGVLYTQSGGWGPTLSNCDVSIIVPGFDPSIQAHLSGLLPDKWTCCGVYAVNKNGVGYGYHSCVLTPDYVPATVTLASANTLGFHHIYSSAVSTTGSGVGLITEKGVVYSTSPNPTIADSHAPVTSSSGAGNYESRMAGIPYRLSTPNEVSYYLRAYIINNEGVTYSTPERVEQTWFGKGYMYNFYMATNPDLPPSAEWKVPSRADFNVLATYLSTNGLTGGDLKSTGVGTQTWEDSNVGATNSLGFNGLGSGAWGCNQPGDTVEAYWSHKRLWMFTTDSFGNTPYLRRLSNTDNTFSEVYTYEFGGYLTKNNGYSIRLLYTGTGNPTSLTDIDGNVYPVTKIGTQYWTAENYRAATLRTGVAIPALSGAAWKNDTSGARQDFPDQFF